MDQPVTFELVDSLKPLSDAQWTSLFKGHPDTAQMVGLMGSCGIPGFKFSSIVARVKGEPLLLMPLFETHYSLSTTLEGKARKIAESLEKLLPGLLRPKVLGVGFVEGEWGQIGINTEFPDELIEKALTTAFEVLEGVAEGKRAQIIALKDFRQETLQQLPQATVLNFVEGVSLPFCQIKTNYADTEDYLNGLPRRVRQDLRRKLRQSSHVRVEVVTDPGIWLPQIYEMYCKQVDKSDMSFGRHQKEYFANVCSQVPGASYILFFLEDELIGFNLIVQAGDMLIDKYIGMVEDSGRANNIYFMAFLEKIRYCTTHGVKLLHLGAAAEGIKVRLGAYALSSYVLFHHRNPIANFALSKMKDALSYKPEVDCLPNNTPDLESLPGALKFGDSLTEEEIKC